MSTQITVPATAVLARLHDLLSPRADRVPPAAPAREWSQVREQRGGSPPVAPRYAEPSGEVGSMQPQLVHIVRRALRKEAATSPLTQRIHAVADRLAGHGWKHQPGDHESLVRQVAHDLYCRLVKRLGAQHG